MSVDHGVIPQPSHIPDFLRVKPGDVVAVEGETDGDDAWVAEVVFVEGSARDPKAPSLFQLSDLDTGVIRWVNADLVVGVIKPCGSS